MKTVNFLNAEICAKEIADSCFDAPFICGQTGVSIWEDYLDEWDVNDPVRF